MTALSAAVLAGLMLPTAGPEPFLPEWPVQLQSDVVAAARKFPGEFAFVVKDVSSGASYTYNAETPMYLASGIKIPVLVALFQEVRAGRIRLSEEMTYTEADMRDGSPALNYVDPGTSLTLRKLAEVMIQRSDNAATDLVIKRLGIRRVNRALRREGIAGFGPITTLIDVRRLVYTGIDNRARRLTPQNIFTLGMTRGLDDRMAVFSGLIRRPRRYTGADYARGFDRYYRLGYNSAPLSAMVELLERLATGKVVSQAHSVEMLDIMSGTKTGVNRLRAGLPPDVRLAHKTGSQFRRACDFGIVFMPDGREIVMVVAAKGGRGRSQSEALMAHLARRAYWRLASPIERRRVRKLEQLRAIAPFDVEREDPDDLRARRRTKAGGTAP